MARCSRAPVSKKQYMSQGHILVRCELRICQDIVLDIAVEGGCNVVTWLVEQVLRTDLLTPCDNCFRQICLQHRRQKQNSPTVSVSSPNLDVLEKWALTPDDAGNVLGMLSCIRLRHRASNVLARSMYGFADTRGACEQLENIHSRDPFRRVVRFR